MGGSSLVMMHLGGGVAGRVVVSVTAAVISAVAGDGGESAIGTDTEATLLQCGCFLAGVVDGSWETKKSWSRKSGEEGSLDGESWSGGGGGGGGGLG